MSEILPQVGAWYKKPNGRLFEVVAIDEQDGTVEMQHYDGTVEEVDFDAWEELAFMNAEPPEDWAGSFDIEKEDYGVDFSEAPHQSWASPLDFLDFNE